MVPIVELFNHHNMDVFFDFDYKAENPNRPSDFKGLGEPRAVSEQEID